MMKKLLAVLALAGMPGCCVAGAAVGGATHPKESERTNAEVAGFAVGLAFDLLTLYAVSQMTPKGLPAAGGSTD